MSAIALDRRVRRKLFEIECWVASKEDFILSKLVFGGWQDYADALGCWMRFNKELDRDYLLKISKDLGIYKEFKLISSGVNDPDDFFKKLSIE